MNSPLYHLFTLQLRLFYRSPGILFWAFFFPILMAWILGVSFANKGLVTKTVGVLVQDNQQAAHFKQWLTQHRQALNMSAPIPDNDIILGARQGTPTRFRFIFIDQGEAMLALKRGKISLYLEEDLLTGNLQYHFDPQNAEAQMTYLLLEQAQLQPDMLPSRNQIAPLVAPGSRYIDFLIPGLIGLSVMNSCLWGIGWSLIELRIKKLLRRMAATPMKKSVFFLSHFYNRLVIGTLEALAVYLFALIYFDIEIQGSLLALLLVFISGHASFAGIAFFVGALPKTTQSGNGVINAVTLPMFILSGVFFSYHSLPEWMISVVKHLPLTILADALRGVFIEGAHVTSVLIPSVELIVIGLVGAMIGLKIFRWN